MWLSKIYLLWATLIVLFIWTTSWNSSFVPIYKLLLLTFSISNICIWGLPARVSQFLPQSWLLSHSKGWMQRLAIASFINSNILAAGFVKIENAILGINSNTRTKHILIYIRIWIPIVILIPIRQLILILITIQILPDYRY